jgi:hypothetical protein
MNSQEKKMEELDGSGHQARERRSTLEAAEAATEEA